jgi:hypothetical protein
MMDYCIHDFPEGQCSICLGIEESSDDDFKVTARFDAEFQTWCSDDSCSDRIQPGETTLRWSDGKEVLYTHEGCTP